MKTSTMVWAIVVLVFLFLGGWYFISMKSAQPGTYPSTNTGINGSPDQTNGGQRSVAPLLSVATDPKLGDHLVAWNGMTLYRYTNDTENVSTCSGTCIAAWPAYSPIQNEPLTAADNVTGMLSTIMRADGVAQVTYKGVPLYFWKSDVKPGDTTGQGVAGVWFVVKP